MSDPRVEPPPDPEVLAALAAAGLSYRTEQQALICTPCETAISKKSALRHLGLQHPSIEKSVQLAAAAALKTFQPIDPNKLPVPAAIVPAVDFLSSLGPGWICSEHSEFLATRDGIKQHCENTPHSHEPPPIRQVANAQRWNSKARAWEVSSSNPREPSTSGAGSTSASATTQPAPHPSLADKVRQKRLQLGRAASPSPTASLSAPGAAQTGFARLTRFPDMFAGRDLATFRQLLLLGQTTDTGRPTPLPPNVDFGLSSEEIYARLRVLRQALANLAVLTNGIIAVAGLSLRQLIRSHDPELGFSADGPSRAVFDVFSVTAAAYAFGTRGVFAVPWLLWRAKMAHSSTARPSPLASAFDLFHQQPEIDDALTKLDAALTDR
ncbi:hypothetical protein OC842_007739, partial [Tilletia horrida]